MSTGSFIWYELMAKDPDAAAKFYGAVVGWKLSPPALMPDGKDYRAILRSDGGSAGGVLKLGADMISHGAQTHLARLSTCGGRRCRDPRHRRRRRQSPHAAHGSPRWQDRHGRGSDGFPVLRDGSHPRHPASLRRRAMCSTWRNRSTSAGTSSRARILRRAKTFYAQHFNFEFNEVMPMGPMGDYCFIDHDKSAHRRHHAEAGGKPHRHVAVLFRRTFHRSGEEGHRSRWRKNPARSRLGAGW